MTDAAFGWAGVQYRERSVLPGYIKAAFLGKEHSRDLILFQKTGNCFPFHVVTIELPAQENLKIV